MAHEMTDAAKKAEEIVLHRFPDFDGDFAQWSACPLYSALPCQ